MLANMKNSGFVPAALFFKEEVDVEERWFCSSKLDLPTCDDDDDDDSLISSPSQSAIKRSNTEIKKGFWLLLMNLP